MLYIDPNRKSNDQHIRTRINHWNILIVDDFWYKFVDFYQFRIVYFFSTLYSLTSCEVHLMECYRRWYRISYDLSTWAKYQCHHILIAWNQSVWKNHLSYKNVMLNKRDAVFPCAPTFISHIQEVMRYIIQFLSFSDIYSCRKQRKLVCTYQSDWTAGIKQSAFRFTTVCHKQFKISNYLKFVSIAWKMVAS